MKPKYVLWPPLDVGAKLVHGTIWTTKPWVLIITSGFVSFHVCVTL